MKLLIVWYYLSSILYLIMVNICLLLLASVEQRDFLLFNGIVVLQDLIALSHSMDREEERERLSVMMGEICQLSQSLYLTIVEDLGLEQALQIFMDDICAP